MQRRRHAVCDATILIRRWIYGLNHRRIISDSRALLPPTETYACLFADNCIPVYLSSPLIHLLLPYFRTFYLVQKAHFHLCIFLLTSGFQYFPDTFASGFWFSFSPRGRKEKEREREKEREIHWMARARRRKIESVEWIEATRFLIHWFPQIDAERLAYGGVLSGIFRARNSVDSSVKYKNDTEGGSKKDIPMKRFLFFSLFFSFLFLSFFFIAIDQTNVNRTYLFFRTTLIVD